MYGNGIQHFVSQYVVLYCIFPFLQKEGKIYAEKSWLYLIMKPVYIYSLKHGISHVL